MVKKGGEEGWGGRVVRKGGRTGFQKCLKMAMKAAERPPQMGRVTNQANTMLRKMLQSTFSFALNLPTNTTEPTWGGVV